MKLAKKLACLALAGVIALAQVPVAMAGEETLSSSTTTPSSGSKSTNSETPKSTDSETQPSGNNDPNKGQSNTPDSNEDKVIVNVEFESSPIRFGSDVGWYDFNEELVDVFHPEYTVKFSSNNPDVVFFTSDSEGSATLYGGVATITAEAIKYPASRSELKRKSDTAKVIVDGWDAELEHFWNDGSMAKNSFILVSEQAKGGKRIPASDVKNSSEEASIFYVDSDGVKVVNKTVSVGGVSYKFDEEGCLVAHWTNSSESSDSSDSSSGGGSGSGSGSGAGAVGGSTESPSGALVSSNTITAADGSLVTTTTVSLGGKTMTIVDQVKTLENGAIQRTYQVAGDVSGLTFAGVGTVSADGATLTTPEGQTYPVVSAPMSIIVNPDGTSVGCFIDPATGQAMTFGNSPANAVMQLGADGQMHAHWVDANGFFLTGTVVMNGMMIVFNEEGIMVSYSALAM